MEEAEMKSLFSGLADDLIFGRHVPPQHLSAKELHFRWKSDIVIKTVFKHQSGTLREIAAPRAQHPVQLPGNRDIGH